MMQKEQDMGKALLRSSNKIRRSRKDGSEAVGAIDVNLMAHRGKSCGLIASNIIHHTYVYILFPPQIPSERQLLCLRRERRRNLRQPRSSNWVS